MTPIDVAGEKGGGHPVTPVDVAGEQKLYITLSSPATSTGVIIYI